MSLASIQVISGLRKEDGGPSYSVPHLNEALVRAGIAGRIFTNLELGEAANRDADSIVSFRRQYGWVPFLRKLQFSSALRRQLFDRRDRIDIIHSHVLCRMPNIYADQAARWRGIAHIISPRGMLSRVALEFSPTSKQLFWALGQRAAISRASCVHATSLSEYQEIREAGIRSPVTVIPNGVDPPEVSFGQPHGSDTGSPRLRTFLYLGRIHPKKGLDGLIYAWASVADDFPDWRLRIVGPGEQMHIQSIKQLVATLNAPRISIEGAIYGEEKWRALAEADLFVLPSHNENFGLAVAESLACGRPVIVTKSSPWQGVETNRCGWWIDSGPEPMIKVLRKGAQTPIEVLDEMGRRGEQWVRREFSWNVIGAQMAQVYRWLCDGEPRPDSVILD